MCARLDFFSCFGQGLTHGASKTPFGGHANPIALAIFVPIDGRFGILPGVASMSKAVFRPKSASSSEGCFEHPAFLRPANANSKKLRSFIMPHSQPTVLEEYLDLLKKYDTLQQKCLALYAELERRGIQPPPPVRDSSCEKEVGHVLQ